MNVSITDIREFINSIHDCIVERYEIIPRDFETSLIVGDKSYIWHKTSQRLETFDCAQCRRTLHIHKEYDNDELLICCNDVDIVALKYLNSSIFGRYKSIIISTLHSWLPSATYQYVKTTIAYNITHVESYFEPSYLYFLKYNEDIFKGLVYSYFNSNIVNYESYNLGGKDDEIFIMVRPRARSRSRSMSPARRRRSRSPSAGRRRVRRTRQRRRSSSRSRSSSAPRRRSRSRSRSMSR